MKVRPLLGIVLVFTFFGLPSRGDEDMRKVQEELRRRNLYFGDIDGLLTPEVARAVQKYQERKGFPATGDVDRLTKSSILDGTPFVTTKEEHLPSKPLLKGDMKLPKEEQIVRETEPAIHVAEPTLEDPSGLENGAAIRNLVAVAEAPQPPAAAAPSTKPGRSGSPKTRSGRRSLSFESSSKAPRATPDLIESVIRGYLLDSGSVRPATETEYYSDRVSYLDRGMVNRRYVNKQLREYYKLWPERKYTLIGDAKNPIQYIDGPAANEMTVKFRSLQELRNQKKNLAARVETDHLLVFRAEATDLRIAAVDERRVTSKTRALEAQKKREKSKASKSKGKSASKKKSS